MRGKLKDGMNMWEKRNKTRRLGTGLPVVVILLLPVAIAINIVGGQTCSILKIPLNMDVIGVALVGALAGPVPAALTGALSNLANGIVDPTYIPYAISAFLIGLTIGGLARYGMLVKPWKMAVSGILIALVGATSGTAVSIFFFGGISGGGDSAVVAVLLATGKQLLVSVFSVALVTEIISKILTVMIIYFIIRAIPARSLVKFPLGIQYVKKGKKQ